jgi:hypothetical protein
MADMAIGNPVSPVAQRWRFWVSFPGIHIAQFHPEVIGNCGVIPLVRCINRGKGNPLNHRIFGNLPTDYIPWMA